MKNPILSEIDEAASELGLKASTLCLRAIGNGHLPSRLKEGGSVTVATMDKIRTFVAQEKARRETAA